MTNKLTFALVDLEEFDPQPSTRSGRERRFLCPICGSDKPKDAAHRSLCANLETGAWNCKRCKATGKLTDFWVERPKTNTREMARRQVARAFSLPEPTPNNTTSAEATATNWRDQLLDIRVLDCESSGAAETYLRSRGIDLETAKASGTMFGPKFYGAAAVIFPICDRDGHQTGTSGRYINANAKIKTRIAGTKKNGLFATLGAMNGKSGAPIIITEAPIDALSLATVGFPAIALCGTSAPTWIHLLCGLKRVLLAFDADSAGDNAAAKLTAFLAPYGARCERLRPVGAKDWNEFLKLYGRETLTDFLVVPVLMEANR